LVCAVRWGDLMRCDHRPGGRDHHRGKRDSQSLHADPVAPSLAAVCERTTMSLNTNLTCATPKACVSQQASSNQKIGLLSNGRRTFIVKISPSLCLRFLTAAS
jgi:hypothetical protein